MALRHGGRESVNVFVKRCTKSPLSQEPAWRSADLRERLRPDVAVILGDRYEELKNATVIPIIPEIMAEVLSPEETPRMIDRKLRQYFDAGVQEVWLIHPGFREIEVRTEPRLPGHALAIGDALTSKLLPGFELPLLTTPSLSEHGRLRAGPITP
jgi:Uma2 family endonuclease